MTRTPEQDRRISQAVEREGARLRRFIGYRVADPRDVEEVLQEVFSELVEAYRLLKHPEQVTAWLFRVARNRITDLFRKKGREAEWSAPPSGASQEPTLGWEELLPAPDAGPEAELERGAILDEIEDALDELPAEQRAVFLAHELDGESFKEMSARTGVPINTLLARKHYAVLHLRRRLRVFHDELTR